MNKKLNTLQKIYSITGIIAILIYIMLTCAGSNNVFLAVRVITATIALIAYAIKFGAEIASDEMFGNSIFFMAICIFDIVWSLIQMI